MFTYFLYVARGNVTWTCSRVMENTLHWFFHVQCKGKIIYGGVQFLRNHLLHYCVSSRRDDFNFIARGLAFVSGRPHKFGAFFFGCYDNESPGGRLTW